MYSRKYLPESKLLNEPNPKSLKKKKTPLSYLIHSKIKIKLI